MSFIVISTGSLSVFSILEQTTISLYCFHCTVVYNTHCIVKTWEMSIAITTHIQRSTNTPIERERERERETDRQTYRECVLNKCTCYLSLSAVSIPLWVTTKQIVYVGASQAQCSRPAVGYRGWAWEGVADGLLDLLVSFHPQRRCTPERIARNDEERWRCEAGGGHEPSWMANELSAPEPSRATEVVVRIRRHCCSCCHWCGCRMSSACAVWNVKVGAADCVEH